MIKITSRSNPAVQEAASLKEKKYRDRSKSFLVEGKKLFSEVLLSGAEIEQVFVTEQNLSICGGIPEDRIFEVTDSVLEKISSEKSPEGIICVVKAIDKIHIINKIYNKEDFKDGRRILLLSSLRDPGNVGTIIRSAAALGCDELILSSDCADIYSSRAIRASMGTAFRQRVTYVASLVETVLAMNDAGYLTYAAVLDDSSCRLDKMNITPKTAFIVGNEGHGIDKEVIKAAKGTAYIPMTGGVESLNAATAASLFLWQSSLFCRDL